MTIAHARFSLPMCALLLAWQGRPSHAGITNKFAACKLLTVEDAAVILGAGTTSLETQQGQLCTFTSADHKKKLMVRTPESSRTKPDVTFEQYKTGPHHGFTIADEPELGDHAVSALTPYGVEFMILKKDHILFVQDAAGYGVKGTPEMLATAKPIIKKAVNNF